MIGPFLRSRSIDWAAVCLPVVLNFNDNFIKFFWMRSRPHLANEEFCEFFFSILAEFSFSGIDFYAGKSAVNRKYFLLYSMPPSTCLNRFNLLNKFKASREIVAFPRVKEYWLRLSTQTRIKLHDWQSVYSDNEYSLCQLHQTSLIIIVHYHHFFYKTFLFVIFTYFSPFFCVGLAISLFPYICLPFDWLLTYSNRYLRNYI